MNNNVSKFFSLIVLSVFSLKVSAHDLYVVNAQIINPAEKMAAKLGYIVIHDDKIQRVGYGHVKAPKNIQVYNANNQYIIPGLIDSHNHIDKVLGVNEDQYALHPQFVTDYRKQLPRSYLYFGYTTIIDVATHDQTVIQTFNAAKTHPDLYTCGGAITTPNGYPMNYLPQDKRFVELPNFVYSSKQNIKLPKNIDPSLHTPAAVIKRIVKANPACVKIFYESGFDADTNLPVLSLATTKEIIKLAHQNHLPVLIHANSFKAQKFALASGVDIFAHGLWLWGPYDDKPALPSAIQKILDEVIVKHLGYQPTMQVINGIYASTDLQFLADPQLTKVVPYSLLSWYKTKEGQWFSDSMQATVSKSILRSRLQVRQSQLKRVVNYLQKNHAQLLFGTDTPASPAYGNPPGYNGYLEMQAWHKAGISLSEILRAATIRNAKFLNLENKYGSVAPGKVANLIIMKKNPLLSISAYDSISSIILHGTVHTRSEFLANYTQEVM